MHKGSNHNHGASTSGLRGMRICVQVENSRKSYKSYFPYVRYTRFHSTAKSTTTIRSHSLTKLCTTPTVAEHKLHTNDHVRDIICLWLIVRQGVKGLATANCVTLNFENLSIIPMGAAVHTNEFQLTHAVGPDGTATEQPNAQASETYQRIIQFPKAIVPNPNKEDKKGYIALTFKKSSAECDSF